MVNAEIRKNSAVEIEETDIDTAKAKGAMALFGEKYGERVRVLTMGGGFSVELCGGTHVSRTGDIGLFKIVSESGVAAGIRRIEAVTGQGALDLVAANERQLKNVAALVRGGRDEVVDKVQQLIERSRALEREVQQLKARLASGAGGRDLLDEAVDVGGIKLVAARIDGVDNKALRDTVDRLKDRLSSGVVVLGAAEGDKVRLVAGVTKDLTDRIAAGELIRGVAERVGGKGGGRPDFAQAGGNKPEALDEALASVKAHIAGLSHSRENLPGPHEKP